MSSKSLSPKSERVTPRVFSSANYRIIGALMLALAISAPQRVYADDTADEAELQFQLGAEKFVKNDFRAALVHFLQSNRLAPNRNVIFNIATCYERLSQFPDAYRYFALALDGETDTARQQKIRDALAALAPRVAEVQVITDPPGATLYVDRKDLGPRGASPRSLAFAGGTISVIAELAGYEPAVSDPITVSVGSKVTVKLALKRILGTVQIDSEQPELSYSLDDGPSSVVTSKEIVQELVPGRHTVTFRARGYDEDIQTFDVLAKQTLIVRPRLQKQVGNLAVVTDEKDTEIVVDGQSMGKTPVFVSLPVGKHLVKTNRTGFRSIQREIEIKQNDTVRMNLELRAIDEISAASRAIESIEDAPSSVSILGSNELRAMGYPTLGESLRGVRGFYLTDNRAYTAVGVRGLSLPGDFGQRLLVLLDGHPINDNYIGSSYVGFDSRADIEDIDHIEVVRGPGSVLYGSNAFSGVVNLVSRAPKVERVTGEVGLSAVEYGVARGRVRADFPLGKDGGAWVSLSGAHGEGRTFYFSELATNRSGGDVVSRGADGFMTGTLSTQAWYKSFRVQAFYNSREKAIPTGWYETTLSDKGNRVIDTRGFVEAKFEPKLSDSVQLFARAFYNQYHFTGRYVRPSAEGGIGRDTFRGDWAGFEGRAVIAAHRMIKITVGTEAQEHFRVAQTGADADGQYLNRNDPFQVVAGYLNTELSPSKIWRISAGGRLDYYSTFGGSAVSPRLAIIVHPTDDGTLKLLGGRAFRAPSVYELYYNDGGVTQVVSTNLKPETIYSAEVEYSHRLTATTVAQVGVFTNLVHSLIGPVGEGTETNPLRYENSRADVLIVGSDAEIRRDWRQGWMIATAYSLQRAYYLQSANENPQKRNLSNSPMHLASVKGAVPLFGRALTLMNRLTVETGRYDRNDDASLPRQTLTKPAAIWDITLSGAEDSLRLHYALGVYNVFDWQHRVPLSSEFPQTTLVQNGRTFLLSASMAF